jgi:hypothetical protein
VIKRNIPWKKMDSGDRVGNQTHWARAGGDDVIRLSPPGAAPSIVWRRVKVTKQAQKREEGRQKQHNDQHSVTARIITTRCARHSYTACHGAEREERGNHKGRAVKIRSYGKSENKENNNTGRRAVHENMGWSACKMAKRNKRSDLSMGEENNGPKDRVASQVLGESTHYAD